MDLPEALPEGEPFLLTGVVGVVLPTPATSAVLIQLKAGEAVGEVVLMPKTLLQTFGGARNTV